MQCHETVFCGSNKEDSFTYDLTVEKRINSDWAKHSEFTFFYWNSTRHLSRQVSRKSVECGKKIDCIYNLDTEYISISRDIFYINLEIHYMMRPLSFRYLHSHWKNKQSLFAGNARPENVFLWHRQWPTPAHVALISYKFCGPFVEL